MVTPNSIIYGIGRPPRGEAPFDTMTCPVPTEGLEPVEEVVTQEMVERNSWACEDWNPWYIEDSPWGGTIASPCFPCMYQNAIWGRTFGGPGGGGLHTHERFDFVRPLKVGTKIKVSYRLKDRYEKRGRTYFVQEFIFTDEEGNEIVRLEKRNTPSAYQNPEDRPR
ncbi:MaoC family dehydratase N-terminal domain-containing protein [Chloroflexota bacterium]